MPLDNLLARCRVVLVRTEVPGNIGATARIMKNMGLVDLALVQPACDPFEPEARKRSTHGEAILNQGRITADLSTAVADCHLVVAASARTGGLFRRQSVVPLRQLAPSIIEAAARGPVALVFGPEPTGLTNEEITQCHYQLTIPSSPDYPALNLAMAVAITLYEIRCSSLSAHPDPSEQDRPAAFEELERMFDSLRSALEEVHFLYGEKADSLMHALRHLIGRAKPSQMEVGVLFGLARQLRWFAQNKEREDERKPQAAIDAGKKLDQ